MEPYYAFPDPPAPPAYVEFRVGDDQDELGFTTASVIDPFGNILGVMHNPHYLEVLARRSAS